MVYFNVVLVDNGENVDGFTITNITMTPTSQYIQIHLDTRAKTTTDISLPSKHADYPMASFASQIAMLLVIINSSVRSSSPYSYTTDCRRFRRRHFFTNIFWVCT